MLMIQQSMLMYFIFNKYNASLKTDTCKVPEITGRTGIYRRSVV